MVYSSSVSLSATTSERGQWHLSATIVAARAVAAYVLGAVLRGVTLYGSDYQWTGCSDAEARALEAVVQAVVSTVARLANATTFGADVYRHTDSRACDPAREILSRADVQRALDALTAALLIDGTLTGDEVEEIILSAFVAD